MAHITIHRHILRLRGIYLPFEAACIISNKVGEGRAETPDLGAEVLGSAVPGPSQTPQLLRIQNVNHQHLKTMTINTSSYELSR